MNAALSNFRRLHLHASQCIAVGCKLTCKLGSNYLPIHDECREPDRDHHYAARFPAGAAVAFAIDHLR